MKPLLPLLLFLPALVLTRKAAAQDSASRVSILISPALFVPVSAAVQAGVQFRVNERCAFLAEAAYPAFYPQNDYEKISYWRGAFEWRFYSAGPQTSGKYYAVRAAYLHRQLVDSNEGIVHRKDGEYRYNEATIQSPVLSLALIIGKEFRSKNRRFFADVFAGAGIRRLFNHYTAKDLRLTSLDRPKDNFEWLFPEEGWRFDYSLTRFHLTAGLRFGWRL